MKSVEQQGRGYWERVRNLKKEKGEIKMGEDGPQGEGGSLEGDPISSNSGAG